ncbi:hypothetical protein PILCRDRAFT_172666 [Piloderma croceum F 1598]|uniref:Uncharacterized protein n=1 Tax=Piloderma croceum (strain F 1598) TaxID=765440 RepID=A0A0C3G1J9_PILCF|nr:hypothetical protein PILCRDRAFT_172666 [Piloderma croceum F 1598]
MRHSVYYQFRDSNQLVCVLQMNIDPLNSNFCVLSGSKWCGYFNHKAWLTILASLCAISVEE